MNNEIKLDKKATDYLKDKIGGEGGTTVVANPTLAGTEDNLTGLEVDGTKYKVPEGTTVVANPTLAGTEQKLTGLQVGETKYKVPVPPTPTTTKLYTHMYGVKGNDRNMVFTLLSDDGTEFTVQEVIDKLESLGCAYSVGSKESSIMYPASGVDYSGKKIIGVSVNEEYGQKQLVFIDSDFNPATTLASALSFSIHVVAQL